MTRIVGVFGVRTRYEDGSDVFKDVRGHVSDFDRVGVVDNHITACGNLTDSEYAILEGVICTVNAYDFTSKVVGIGQTSVFDVMILSVMHRDSVGNDFTRLSLCLIGSLADGNYTIVGLFNINGVRGDVVVGAIFAVNYLCNVLNDGGILSLHRVGVGDVDGLASSDSRNSPCLIAIVSVIFGACGFNAALEVVGIDDLHILNSLGGSVLHGNRVGHNLVYHRNVLVGSLDNVDRRRLVFDDSSVQNLRSIAINNNIAEVERYALACLDSGNRVGVISVIGNAVHRLEVEYAIAIEEVLDDHILGISSTAVLNGDGVV